MRAFLVVMLLGGTALAEPAGMADREIGVRLGVGLEMGGVGAGGLRVGGAFLYRMSSDVWFDGEALFTFGSSDRICYLDRAAERVCEPGISSGSAFRLAAGVRWVLNPERAGFTPYLRGGVGLDLVTFSGDDIVGAGLPLWMGFGGRFHISSGVSLSVEANLTASLLLYGGGVGGAGSVGLGLLVGVDIALR
jgi:hypothetical protein